MREKFIEAVAYKQVEVFDAAITFSRSEGIIPAPESAHAIKSAIDQALVAKQEGKSKVILFNLSGHGHFDMAAYDNYFSGKLVDLQLPEGDIEKTLELIKDYPPVK
jgi:tryptophan synthase beta chain